MTDQDPRLEQLRATLIALARRSPPRERTRTIVRTSQVVNAPRWMRFGPEDEVLLAAGSGSLTATSLDLTTLIPSGCSCAYVRFSADAGGSGDAITLSVRPDTENIWTVPLRLVALQGTDDTASSDNSEWVRLAADRRFDLQVTSIGSPNWSLTLLGYC